MAIFEINYPTESVRASEYLKRNDLSISAKGMLHMLFFLEDEWDGSLEGLYMSCEEENDCY